MPTIKDIASETGLGLATISKYLNGGNVRAENKILIDKAIKKLDYTVNEFARGLKTNKSKMIAIVIPELSNLFTTTIISKIENILRQNAYGVMVLDYSSSEKIESEIADFLISKKVDGVVYMPIHKKSSSINKLLSHNIPLVFIDRKIDDINSDFIGVNNIKAGEDATKLLIESGHTKIAVIAGPKLLKTTTERLKGYKNALLASGISENKNYIMLCDFTIEDGYKGMKHILEHEKKITAVFATNYEMTLGAIMAINEKNIKIPQDISFIGFDNIELSKVISPQLSIVSQPINEIATRAAEALLKRLSANGASSQIILDCYIEHGKSIKKIN